MKIILTYQIGLEFRSVQNGSNFINMDFSPIKFGVWVDPILSRGTDYAHSIIGPPGFENGISASLLTCWLKSVHYKRRAFWIFTSQKSNTFVEIMQNIVGMARIWTHEQ